MLPGLLEKRILAMDWDDRQVRVVHAAVRKKGVRVLSVQSFAIPEGVSPADPHAFGKLIAEYLDQEGISTRSTIVDIPRDRAVVKMLKGLPPAGPEHLPGVVAMQFERELSFPASKASIDYAEPVLDPATQTYSALVAAVQSDVLESYLEVCRAAGLKVERVGLRPHANRIAVNAILDPGRHEQVLFVDVRPSLTEIDVISEGQLMFTRAASVHVPRVPSAELPTAREPEGSETGLPIRLSQTRDREGAPPDSERVVNALVVEVIRSLEAWRADSPGARVTHVVVGGDSGVEEALADALRDRLNMTAELFSPAAYFGWDAQRGAAASAFASTLGLVIGHAGEAELHFDFLNPKRTVTATEKRLKKLPMAAAVAALFVTAGAITYFRAVAPQKGELASLAAQLDKARDTEKEYKNFHKLIEEVEDVEAEQLVWLDELHDVLSCLPGNEELVLESIDMRQKDRRITLKIKAKDNETLSQTEQRIEEFRAPEHDGKHFDADLKGTRRKRGDYPWTTEITVTVVGQRPLPVL